MLYDSLKILHILSATMLLTGIVYSYYLWKRIQNPNEVIQASQQIQTQTWLIVIPSALFQLMTGFTMISLKHYDYSELWITSSVIGFIIVIGSWFSFVYFLLLSQQLVTEVQNATSTDFRFKFFRRIQSTLLILCLASLLSMVFFMANKV